MEDLIEEEDVVITISHLGYIKRTSVSEYRQQKRGGRGAIGSKTREEDYVEHLFIASTHDTMLFFTEKGRCFWLRVYEIPEGEKTSKGRAVQNLIQIPPDDKVKAIIEVRKLDDKEYVQNHFIILCTKRGIIKKTCLEDFSRPRVSGVNAITINEGDELLAARLSAFVAVLIAGYFGINPPGFVAAVVALAFGLAAASFFPAIILGIFDKRMNKEGAIAGMVVGMLLMLFYMMKFKLGFFGGGDASGWWFGISPEGFGTVAMILNFAVSIVVMKFTAEPPKDVQEIVENIRIPNGPHID